MKFNEFPKIARLNRDIVITEKLDGTNAQICILSLNNEHLTSSEPGWLDDYCLARKEDLLMFAGSRTKWITPGKQTDNYGFAGWVKENSEELFKLGEGHHFGEWRNCIKNGGIRGGIICGWIEKEIFFQKGIFYPAGSQRLRDDGTTLIYRQDNYNIQNYLLNDIILLK